ncbi:alpha/beta hydrolase-fold protein [Uliginosibacterium sp. H3]|uniref:Alpha/beta hydrolase-fold protein n=1 Tax=Uliginosibacterium silvisoli TaxID=3114758 RepID=A0ABU6K341_9RHOO|nr:alpha/beta hydrolase-fold protein [Uliginosibacterium sp. H3]
MPITSFAQAATADYSTLAPLPASWQPAQLSRSVSFEIDSKYTGQRYRILVGLPHKAAPASGYPTLWMLDGLASFPITEFMRPRPASPTDSAQYLAKIGDEPAGLVVAIGYTNGQIIDVNGRALDYTPELPPGTKTGDALSPRHGGAASFLKFLTVELRPVIAERFKMDPQRHTLFGFSYGGLFTLHTLETQPQFFQRYWAASPSLWFGENYALRQLPQRVAALQFAQPAKVMITVGMDEQYPEKFADEATKKRLQTRAMVDNVREFGRVLTEAKVPNLGFEFQSVAGHDHHDMLMHGARRVVDFAFAP